MLKMSTHAIRQLSMRDRKRIQSSSHRPRHDLSCFFLFMITAFRSLVSSFGGILANNRSGCVLGRLRNRRFHRLESQMLPGLCMSLGGFAFLAIVLGHDMRPDALQGFFAGPFRGGLRV